MKNPLDFAIGDSLFCPDVRECGFSHFIELAEYIRSLPYGRPGDLVDPVATLRERRGTCSAKHRLLALVAHESGHPEVHLTVGIYEMSDRNTPGIGAVLRQASMRFLPEAHCYLSVEGRRFDFTGLAPAQESPFDSLVAEHFVTPDQLSSMKETLHKQFLAPWARSQGMSFSDVWRTREACIAALSANNTLPSTRTDART